MKRVVVYRNIDIEREYQDQKWTEGNRQNGVPDGDKSVAEWINYMEFHLNKAKEMIYKLNQTEALGEIRKVTALGVRTMEIHGCSERILMGNSDASSTDLGTGYGC